MASTHGTPISFLGAIRLCLLLLFSPSRFQQEQEKDNALLRACDGNVQKDPVALVVRRAFFTSLVLVVVSGAVGYGVGLFLGNTLLCASSKVVVWLQIVGASTLLWGTLFVRGWEIQTHGGTTLVERVNQWLYRFLYCVGTAILVCSVAWPSCA